MLLSSVEKSTVATLHYANLLKMVVSSLSKPLGLYDCTGLKPSWKIKPNQAAPFPTPPSNSGGSTRRD